MIKLKKFTLTITMISIVIATAFVLAMPISVNAGATVDLWGGNNLKNEISNEIALGDRDPRLIAASVINVVLGFIGIIAVVLVLVAGFKWMTAAGNEDKIGEAKGMLAAGIIGLIIVLASWGLAKFIVNLMYEATTNGL